MIEIAVYINPEHTVALTLPENRCIPVNSNGYLVQELLDWVEAGNTITPYSEPVASIRSRKKDEIRKAYEEEANKDVTSQGLVWRGGLESALLLKGAFDLYTHKGNVKGTVHSKDHVPHSLTPVQIESIAADVSDSFQTARNKYEAKLLEIDACLEDGVCISNVKWV